jgi:2-polyprenyl-3-methyl-5-hydroxy-6-metoxy-1,4-benzoquinol methylase
MTKITKKKTFEEQYFEGWFKGAVGKFNDRDLELSRRWFFSWLKKLHQHIPLQDGKGKRVLEIGCSIGGVASLLRDRDYTVYASDISEYAVNKAKKLSKGINFLVFDVQKGIPLKQKFDLIIAFEVVEHLRFPQKAITNMVASLKEGGTLVISTPYPYPWSYRDPTHINVKYPEEWMAMMRKAQLQHVAYHKFSLVPFFYKLNKHFQIIIPFHISHPSINTPIFYIGKKV